MRTIGPQSNILLAIAAAFGIIAALDRPWYGRGAEPTDARMEDMFGAVGRAFSDPAGRTGWAVFGTLDLVLAGLAVATAALVVGALVPSLRAHVAALARWTSLAAVGVLLFALIDAPGGAATAEPRQGLLIALGAAGVLVVSVTGVAGAPVRRRAPVKTYTPPPVPVYEPEGSYGPPQY
jgi:hypothetical protein